MVTTNLETYRSDLANTRWWDMADHSTISFSTTRNRVPGDIPAGTIMWGQTRPGQSPVAREAQYGTYLGLGHSKLVNAFHVYTSNGNNAHGDITTILAGQKARGEAIFYDVKPPGTWTDMKNGVYDTWITNTLGDLDALDVPVFLSVYDEPDNDTGQGPPSDWVAMQTRIHGILGTGTKISLCPILEAVGFDHLTNGSGVPLASDQGNLADWYNTGSSDCWAINGYNHWAVGKPDWRWHEPDQAYGYIFDWFDDQDPNRPKVVPEFGVHTDPRTPGRAAQWLIDCYNYFIERGVIMACFFDSDQQVNDGGPEWTLDYTGDGTDGTERFDEFADLLNLSTSVYQS